MDEIIETTKTIANSNKLLDEMLDETKEYLNERKQYLDNLKLKKK